VENGKLQRIWGSSRDVTELRALEAQFRHAQKLESLGKLAGGVAHDFNNLLTIIRGYSSQLLERTENTDDAYIGLEIQRAAERGAALTKQLLTFSRRQSAQMQLLDLNPIVAEDERMLRRLIGKKIELITELEPSLGLVCADAGHMHQVLLNLAVNARDAMPSGGKLIIALSNVDIGETRPGRLAAVEPGPYVRLTVGDNGVGMSADVQEHLFEPFFTTKEANEGTGLGLSTVYGIVRQSGGHITVETEPNKGTTFEILLPRVSSQPRPGPTDCHAVSE
jgi:signal transduction histidine kinase